MKKVIFIILASVMVLSTAGCKKEGVSLVNAGLRDVPTNKKGAYKWIKDINRGQTVKIVKEQTDGDWIRVELSDGETEGWIYKAYIHKGEKKVIEFGDASNLYDQPDVDSKLLAIIPAGTKAIVLRQKGKWFYVNVKWGLEGWVKSADVKEGTDVKTHARHELKIDTIGACTVEASSSLPDSAGYTFGVMNLFDRDPGTSWQVGNGGIGEWVEILLPHPETIRVAVINGLVKTDKKFAPYGAEGDLYVLNNRVKSLIVEYWDTRSKEEKSTVHFADMVRDYQNAGVYKNVSRIRFIVDGTYKGRKWNDTALAEIKIEKQ
jgi:uncharacterized protein YgiM (DUF1202 family)